MAMIATDISPLETLERGELVIDTGLTYDGIAPVRIHVTKRDRRYDVSDGGGAVAAAGADPKRLAFDDEITDGVYSVNVSRQGVVFVPAVASSGKDWLEKLVELVTEGSLVLYGALLDTGE